MENRSNTVNSTRDVNLSPYGDNRNVIDQATRIKSGRVKSVATRAGRPFTVQADSPKNQIHDAEKGLVSPTSNTESRMSGSRTRNISRANRDLPQEGHIEGEPYIERVKKKSEKLKEDMPEVEIKSEPNLIVKVSSVFFFIFIAKNE
jgi:hypothetical protein